MSEIIQWIVVAVVIIGAVLHIYRRLTRPKGGCGCANCDSCPLEPGETEKCKEGKDGG